ncbi:MAG: hypothetical protein IPM35_02950 [Myxococcales bacterium]|nr:hypothetical protein [Myxococcales bacterium]
MSQVKDDHHWVVEERRALDITSGEEFDRIAFAMRALRLLKPPMTVAVYPRTRSLSVERGRDLSTEPTGTWAMLGIPPNASRAHIALAVAELASAELPPWLLDLLALGPDHARD